MNVPYFAFRKGRIKNKPLAGHIACDVPNPFDPIACTLFSDVHQHNLHAFGSVNSKTSNIGASSCLDVSKHTANILLLESHHRKQTSPGLRTLDLYTENTASRHRLHLERTWHDLALPSTNRCAWRKVWVHAQKCKTACSLRKAPANLPTHTDRLSSKEGQPEPDRSVRHTQQQKTCAVECIAD